MRFLRKEAKLTEHTFMTKKALKKQNKTKKTEREKSYKGIRLLLSLI